MSATTGESSPATTIASPEHFREQIEWLSRSMVASFRLSSSHAIPMCLNAVLMELDRLRKEDENVMTYADALIEIDRLVKTLTAIASLGGNLPDEHLTDRTGPNDAAHRGLMYCEARRMARTELDRLRREAGQSAGAGEKRNG